MSDKLLISLEETLGKFKIPERHSFFQIKNFIIGKEPTPAAQLWQIIRELKVRKDQIESIKLQIEDAKDSLEEIELMESENLKNTNMSSALLKIRTRRVDRQKYSLNKTIKNLETKLVYILEETSYLFDAFEAIRKNNPFKEFDDPIAQKEYWNEKITQEINLKGLSGQSVDSELLRTTLSLDDDMPIKQNTMKYLQTVQQQIALKRKGLSKE